MKRFIISYRGEFSTVVEAISVNDALDKVQNAPYAYQWENVGELHPCFLEHVTEHLTEAELLELESS